LPTQKITCTGSQNATLADRLDTPDAAPHAWAVFAHWLTCSKDSKAAACISRALARSGFGVLRFDFTSLGSSERITPAALRVLLHEYRIGFPVGVDMPGESGPLPRTMRAHQLGGTPSLLVFDRTGQLRLNQLGQVDDLPLGALLGELLAQSS